ncbi:hypothetical protein I6A60_24695 [Frankia sp. AgB1.9]|uniref:hypothetical protein n=1 Tax=unclassified Frankia TaxID=2632575 RepID=UPI0019338188|nr:MULTISPECIES: hypothetical protein [unclassified Frankia]MBL7487443.1 hypothetical protein [Frankia sp. AgW1.1]MBL7551039.1 hypothetical protein [Frankia sp. AgB1.9]MBL7618820.1 hypothetical protein [Frankia sp. AgB1.8]
MPGPARRLLIAIGTTTVLTGAAFTVLPSLPAWADPRPISFFNEGLAAHGEVRTDQDREQLIGSLTATGDAPSPAGNAGAAPRCVWETAQRYLASTPSEPGGPAVQSPDRTDADGSVSRLYVRLCDGKLTTWEWFQVQNVPALQAAAEDEVRQQLPTPKPVLSPDPDSGLVVKVATWFAVPAAQWVAVTATAEALGLSVTVTATPDALVFDPGDGAPPATCPGPGLTFDPVAPPPSNTPPPACSYTYRDASTAAANGRSWAASLSVRWRVTWAVSDGETGLLDPLVTTAPFDAVVREYQAVERSG